MSQAALQTALQEAEYYVDKHNWVNIQVMEDGGSVIMEIGTIHTNGERERAIQTNRYENNALSVSVVVNRMTHY